jgi:hypothetical protein
MLGYSIKLGPIALAVCVAWVPKLEKADARKHQASNSLAVCVAWVPKLEKEAATQWRE